MAIMFSRLALLLAAIASVMAYPNSPAPSPSPTPSPAPPPPAAPQTAPFGQTFNKTTQLITCNPITTTGPLITQDQASALVDLYNSTICATPDLTLQGLESIILVIEPTVLIFRNVINFASPQLQCTETAEDFRTLIELCWNGGPSYGGFLIEHEFSNYVIQSTQHNFL